MTPIGTVIDGKYEILKEIGRGGMSVVYLAMDKRLNKQWAVKEIRKKGSGKNDEVVVNSLLAEANLIKRLDHPALPRIVDIIDNSLTIYVIMDYIEGESLDKILAEYGAQPEETVIEWSKQICDALLYLHGQKPPIIYRDMKPANVMLKPEGNIKIIDFGIAREYKENNLADTTVLGTNGYAPPEQYGSRQTDARSDIYALGMTMHHLLTGVDPRPKDYMYYPVRQWKPELSEGIEIIIDKCVQPAPEKRYQSCTELLYDLEHPELITRDYKRRQRRKLWTFLIMLIISATALLSGFVCRTVAGNINASEYETLIAAVDSPESYIKAIGIFPYDTRGYVKLLEAYESQGHFGKEENDQFLALYNAGKDGFDKASADYAELNYKIGMMYFNYYTDADGESSVSNRVQKAYPFFAENHDNERLSPDFAQTELSECYYQICAFYKKYILNSATVEEASKENFEELFAVIKSSIDSVREAGAYDQLSMYNGVFVLIYDQRLSLASVNMEENTVLSMLSNVYNKTKNLSVQKELSKKLQQEILDNYESCREAVDRAYGNSEVREDT